MSSSIPSPDELQREYTNLQDLHPPSPIDTSRQSQTMHDILTSDDDAASFLKLAASHAEILSILKDTDNGEYTVFVPTNQAWQAAAGKHDNLDVLQAHVSPHFVSETGFRHMPNVPTLFTPPASNGPQIIRTRLTPSGWDLNHKTATITRPNVRASNGIIHYINNILLPPPCTLEILRTIPQFSNFHKAVTLASSTSEIFQTSNPGGTLFAPTDAAFTSLGQPTLDFLFGSSNDGDSATALPYLNALVKMHYCPGVTFFSNFIWPKNNKGGRQTSAEDVHQIKGQQKQKFDCALADKQVGVAISRFNGLICTAAADGAALVVEQDLAASDGVLHAINGVLTPDSPVALPLGGGANTLEEFKKLYSPFVV